MYTEPEAPESAGRSQEHLPCVHGTDQSFTARVRRPTARKRVRQNAAEDFTEKGILRKKNVLKQTNECRVKGAKSRVCKKKTLLGKRLQRKLWEGLVTFGNVYE